MWLPANWLSNPRVANSSVNAATVDTPNTRSTIHVEPGADTAGSRAGFTTATSPTANSGSERATNVPRSPQAGSSQKPARSGPRTQPITLAAYARPARSGSPADHQSTSIGVRNPMATQNGTMPSTSRVTPCSDSRGSAVSRGTRARTPMMAQARTNQRAGRSLLPTEARIRYSADPAKLAMRKTQRI